MSPELERKYRIGGLLGEGAHGVVYRATEIEGGRHVALKFLQPEASAERVRFLREMDLLASLSHPNILKILGSGIDEDVPYVVVELVEGEDLERVISKSRLTLLERLAVVVQLAQALHYAHERGIVHRDVKPANVLVGWDLAVRLADLGLARPVEKGHTLTEVGLFVGTPAYIAPEQAMDAEVGPAADQFSLAVMTFELATGRLPFVGESLTECINLRIDGPAPRASSILPDIPLRLDRALARALEREPRRRFHSVHDFGREVARVIGQLDPAGTHPMFEASMLEATRSVVPPTSGVTFGTSLLVIVGSLTLMSLIAGPVIIGIVLAIVRSGG